MMDISLGLVAAGWWGGCWWWRVVLVSLLDHVWIMRYWLKYMYIAKGGGCITLSKVLISQNVNLRRHYDLGWPTESH